MRKHILLIILAIFIVVFSLYVGAQNGDLGGADEKIEDVFQERYLMLGRSLHCPTKEWFLS